MISSYKFYEDFHKKRYKGLIPIPTERDFSYKLIFPFIAKFRKANYKITELQRILLFLDESDLVVIASKPK